MRLTITSIDESSKPWLPGKRCQCSPGLLSKWPLQLETWGPLLIEFSLGSLIWVSELRYVVLGLGIVLHLSIEYAMNFQLFVLLIIACLMLFI